MLAIKKYLSIFFYICLFSSNAYAADKLDNFLITFTKEHWIALLIFIPSAILGIELAIQTKITFVSISLAILSVMYLLYTLLFS
ncbi:hypothetical protein Megvenef_00529 [Candidatus Megaera venefica]|uniref:Uncharacterized protein n=1 Tax=Candidatus Megaera venefica TaxID=2055910 RepID=A0ABU5NBK9_9RICK|nr:hypothetical protein [Candidatus Megaera venefica]